MPERIIKSFAEVYDPDDFGDALKEVFISKSPKEAMEKINQIFPEPKRRIKMRTSSSRPVTARRSTRPSNRKLK